MEYQFVFEMEFLEENMAIEAAQVEVKRERDRLVVRCVGRGPRGQKYIKARRVLDSTSMGDPKFKEQMTAAVDEMLGKTA